MGTSELSRRVLTGPALRLQPDRRLVTLARQGFEPATEEIVRRYRPALVRYAGSIVSPGRAEDIVQDSLVRALPGIEAGNAELHLRPWLYTIVRNAALNDLRDASPPHKQLDESYDGVEQPPQALARRERVRSLIVALQGLPAPQREALLKREMEGRSHAEIGAQMGVSAGAARQLIFRARQALRDGIGSLVPMPLLRQLVEGEGGGAATAAAAGGGTIAVKAAVAVLVTGAAVTAGLAVRASTHHVAAAGAIAAQPLSGPGQANGKAGGGSDGAAEAGHGHGGENPGSQGNEPGGIGPLHAGSGRATGSPEGALHTNGGHSDGSSGTSPESSGGDGHPAGAGGGSGNDGTGLSDGSGSGDGLPDSTAGSSQGSGETSGQPSSADGESSITSSDGGSDDVSGSNSGSSGAGGTSDPTISSPTTLSSD